MNNGAGHNDAVDHYFRLRGQCPLFTQVELSMSASNLCNLDITSKSDPMAVLYVKKMDGTLEELGRTEVILSSLNPAWIEKINVAYQFEIVQNLVFHLYDIKYHNTPVKALKLNEQDFLGETTCVLSEIVTKRNQSLTLNLHGKNGPGGSKNFGTLTVRAEETFLSRMAVEIELRCSQLGHVF